MKAQQGIIATVMSLCAVIGIYALIASRQPTSVSGDDEGDIPTVVSVQVGALARITLHHYVDGYGTVEPAPATAKESAAGAPLAPPAAGVVARVNIVEGQQVKKGDVLMELNSSTLTADYVKQEAARQKRLYAQQNTSLKNVQDAEAQLAALRVVAPLSGTVTRLNVKPGQAVDVNSVVAELADLHRLAVSANIPVSDAGELKVGDDVQVLTQPPVTATVSFISPAVDTTNSTLAVWGALPADSGLRPGQFVHLRIVTAVHMNCLAAPDESVVTDVNGRSTIALVSGNEATHIPVQTGFRENGWVEIEGAGLKAGDAVVTVGAYGLPDKTRIQVASPPGDDAPGTHSHSSPAQ